MLQLDIENEAFHGPAESGWNYNSSTFTPEEYEHDDQHATKEMTIFIWCGIALILSAWSIYQAISCRAARTSGQSNETITKQKEQNQWSTFFEQYPHQMVVSDESIQSVNTANETDDTGLENQSTQIGDEEDPEHGVIVLKNPEEANGTPKTAADYCIICLESYRIGDVAVWSCNEECPHAFHRNCFVDYLSSYQGNGTPCPTCRRNFTNKGLGRATNVTKESESTTSATSV